MPGGFHKVDVTQELKDLVNHNVADINEKSGNHATLYTINDAHSQVVAGTNYFFHLTDNHGEKYSAVVYVPLPHTNAPASVSWASKGHTEVKSPH